MLDDYSTFAVVTIHIGDSYQVPWGSDRRAMYGNIADGYPWFAYDGLFDAWPIETYESKFLSRQAEATDMTISLFGEEISANTYEIVARICVEPGGEQADFTFYTAQVLDHYPDTPVYSRNCLMQAVENDNVTVNPGQCVIVQNTLVFDSVSLSRPDDIKIIAWAQTPGVLWPAEVFQAAQMGWPFASFENVFADGFESSDTALWSASIP